MPYRSARVETPKLTAEAGVVDDMVRQFADRYAFLRELVQNGIDAGATRIDVRLERSPDGAVETSVVDDGVGMTRAIIEGPLLTLFESSKESDPTKIGKYGIGFVSVFAIAPDRVDVRTRTPEGAWLVRLFGDHSFELATDLPRPGNGTEVILHHTMTAEAFAEHGSLARGALVRWCKHAHVPIALSLIDGEAGAENVAINVAMTVPGVSSITLVEGDDRFVVGVGSAAAGGIESEPTFSGFYNRGLTLLETNDAEPGLEWIRFKVDSPRLAHTLSRDNVRRDSELRRLVARVKAIASGPLRETLQRQIGEAAQEAATGGCERYASLLEAILGPHFREHAETVQVPLVEAIDDVMTMELGALVGRKVRFAPKTLLVGDASSPLTIALAAADRPVVRHQALVPLLRRAVPEASLVAAEQACAFALAIEPRPEDRALCAELMRFLAAAGYELHGVRLAGFVGVGRDVMGRVLRGRSRDHEAAARSALRAPEDASAREWGSGSTLFLNADHGAVALARRRARSDVMLAAHLLCRALLVIEGPLSAAVVDRLLDATTIGAGS